MELSEVHKEADSAGRKALIFGGLALIAAGLFGWMLAHLSGSEGKTQAVVVAKRDLPPLTQLTKDDIATVGWPRESLPSGFIADANTLTAISQVNLQELQKNEPILATRVSRTEGGIGVSVLVKPQMRAFVVEVNEPVAKSTILHPGAHVDVLATLADPRGRNNQMVTKAILQNLTILAVGDSVGFEAQEVSKPGERRVEDRPALERHRVVTLEVGLGDLETLAYAASQGKVDLALRSNADTENVSTEGVTTAKILGDTGDDDRHEVRTTGAVEPARSAPTPRARRHSKPAPPQPSGPSIYKVGR